MQRGGKTDKKQPLNRLKMFVKKLGVFQVYFKYAFF